MVHRVRDLEGGEHNADGTVTEYTTLFGDDNPLYLTPSAGEGTLMWYSGTTSHHVGYVDDHGLAGEATLPK